MATDIERTAERTEEKHSQRDLRPGFYEGPNAIGEFLDPGNGAPIPLVELPEQLNPLRSEGVRIFAKLMYLLPLLTVKALPVFHMLQQAQHAGRLRDVHTVIENSSGNTAFCLAVLAKLFGISNVIALVPWDIAPGKLDLLRIAGVEPRLRRDAPDEPSGIAHARDLGRETGVFNPGQYENEDNPAAFEKWMAPEIWRQTQGRLTVFVAGLGTTGTLVGASRYFRGQSRDIRIVGVMCGPDQPVPGVRSESRLRDIAFDWRSAADCVIEAGTRESFKLSLELCQHGLVAGPSSGFALAGLLRYLETQRAISGLDDLRNARGEVFTAFVCGDTPLPYLDKYSTHLDPSDF